MLNEAVIYKNLWLLLNTIRNKEFSSPDEFIEFCKENKEWVGLFLMELDMEG